MTRDEKTQWMATWVATHGLKLELYGECGFGRECVGVTVGDNYPDYMWNDDDFNRIDGNGDVWVPDDAYHKHPCVAVLGRGEQAESQLYNWLKWFDDHGFNLEIGNQPVDPALGAIGYFLGMHRYARMVKNEV